MEAVDLLQRVGLNKYEAEAYAALLTEGPLTGYELGKRSGVPLSRSYETLERLVRRGLALVQPGEPPRYAAEAPERFLARLRADQAATLTALGEALAACAAPNPADGFWVVRGRDNILARVRALVAEARRSVQLDLPPAAAGGLADALEAARARGCGVSLRSTTREIEGEGVALALVDERDGLAGTLLPVDRCQAVVGGNPALTLALRRCFSPPDTLPSTRSEAAAAGPASPRAPDLDWLAWEDRKRERLWRLSRPDRVA